MQNAVEKLSAWKTSARTAVQEWMVNDMELKICKHGNGCGWCSLHKEYCPQSPCEDEELITYAPVKHGKWKYDEDVKALYCGCCGIFAQPQRKTNYCPHCGADMRGE